MENTLLAMSSDVEINLSGAVIAPELVDTSRTPANWPQGCERFALNPATGALEMTPAYRDKAAKALMREVRRMKLGLKLTLAPLSPKARARLSLRDRSHSWRGPAPDRSIGLHVTWLKLCLGLRRPWRAA
jgi:hypothetical protein